MANARIESNKLYCSCGESVLDLRGARPGEELTCGYCGQVHRAPAKGRPDISEEEFLDAGIGALPTGRKRKTEAQAEARRVSREQEAALDDAAPEVPFFSWSNRRFRLLVIYSGCLALVVTLVGIGYAVQVRQGATIVFRGAGRQPLFWVAGVVISGLVGFLGWMASVWFRTKQAQQEALGRAAASRRRRRKGAR